jgi:copper resistance protein D
MEHAEPLIHWPQPVLELAGFLAAFLAAGAVGFRFVVMRRLAVLPAGGRASDASAAGRAGLLRAARLGLLGAVTSAVLLAQRLPELATRQHTDVAHLLTSRPVVGVQVAMLAVALLGFTLAAVRAGAGWWLAAAGVVLAPLRGALLGGWERLVNPLHVLAGGLWIGTLALTLAAGLAVVASDRVPLERRGALASGMVTAFSPLALAAAALLALTGAITAWNHLGRLEAMWTTPYGLTLVAKLIVVAVVVALGYANWRRPRARLGTEAGLRELRDAARAEVLAALVVLLITAVLVSLPSPKR